MPEFVYLPPAGETVTEGKIKKWLKQEGEPVVEGEKICEVMTSKLTVDILSPASGTIFRIFAEAEETVPVGKVIAVIQVGDEKLDSAKMDALPDRYVAAKEKQAVGKEEAVVPSVPAAKKEISKAAGGPREVLATPVARKIAGEHGIDLGNVVGSGPKGRITKEDVLSFVESSSRKEKAAEATGVSGLPYTVVRLEGIRKIIAERMRESVSLKPHVCFEARPNIDNLLRLREEMSTRYGRKISLNSIIMYFLVFMTRKFPMLNAHVVGEEIRQFHKVNLGMAVAREQGLIVPVIDDAGSLGVLDLDDRARELSRKAREDSLSLQEISNGTITVSNLGMFGIRHFNAVINPPEIAILAVGGTEEQLILDEEGKVGKARYLNLNLCVDHCVVDGDVGAGAVMYLKELLENPAITIFEKK